ncbi:asparagine synthase-related protein [Salipaludibacillus sp. HK11]|uniref:asparagine synthase-related protein n=1 Tax=Salipaludibacillus sp. HK11 TaxID=3394320 RepID=UPI0039FCE6D6
MSAIAGLIDFNREPIKSENISNLMGSFEKYPSDAIDVWKKDNVFLGCHAQWITPESIGEVVPYYDYERQLVITADAIIDNREELLNKLRVDNGQRKIMPDSQLILLAYAKWQEETPKHLIGDFAFMIWDERKQKLFGARDFSGARTLYYHFDNNRFAFSTTIVPLFTLPGLIKILNEEWMAEYLAIPNMIEAVDMFSTVYQSIMQIPPSHSITVVDKKVTFSRYSTILVKEKLKFKTNEECEEAFRYVFNEAVIARTRTYGKVGSQLSGGLDSGSVVSFAARALKKQNKKLQTYSYIPEDSFVDWTPNYYIPDERPFIKETVSYVGNIDDQYLNFKGKDPFSDLDEFLEIMEMPYKFFENSFWLKGIYEKAQQQGNKILLGGARGNHSISFGSYQFNMDYYLSLLKRLRWFRLNQELNLYCKNKATGKSVILPQVVKNGFTSLEQIFSKNKFDESLSLINPKLARKFNVNEKIKKYGIDITGSSIQSESEFRRTHFEKLYTWNKSGVANTKLSLKHSLWDRDPTNDIRVIQFCLGIPEEQYANKGLERSLIRRSTINFIPDQVRLNHHSRGVQSADVIFRMLSIWNRFVEELKQLTADPRISEILNIEMIKNILQKFSDQPCPEIIFDEDFRMLTRSLVIYRFIKNHI